ADPGPPPPPDLHRSHQPTITHASEQGAAIQSQWTKFPPDVLRMRIAETDTPPAEPIADALIRAMSDGDIGYAA
ncbi:hypothetical protein ACFZAR_40060, partial [Streptomyces sp. NPDC008222]